MDMRQHLMLNQQRLGKSKGISDAIEEYCKAIEEFNKGAKEPPKIETKCGPLRTGKLYRTKEAMSATSTADQKLRD